MSTNNEEDIKSQIEDITTTTFSIQGVPIKVFKRFLRFCEDNAQMTLIFKDKDGQKQIKKKEIYSIGLAILLDAYETDAKHQLLFDRLTKLEEKVYGNQ